MNERPLSDRLEALADEVAVSIGEAESEGAFVGVPFHRRLEGTLREAAEALREVGQ